MSDNKVFNRTLLRNLRSQKKFTQTQLAEATGSTNTTISTLESGKVLNPVPATVEKLANYFERPSEDFWVEKPVRPVKPKSKASKPKGSVDTNQAAVTPKLPELVNPQAHKAELEAKSILIDSVPDRVVSNQSQLYVDGLVEQARTMTVIGELYDGSFILTDYAGLNYKATKL